MLPSVEISLVSVWTVTRNDDTIGVLSLVETDDDVQLVHTTDIITAMVQGSWQTTEFTVRVPHVREFSNARVLSRPKPHRASLKTAVRTCAIHGARVVVDKEDCEPPEGLQTQWRWLDRLCASDVQVVGGRV